MKNLASISSRTTKLRPSAEHAPNPSIGSPELLSKPTRRQFLVQCSVLAVATSMAPEMIARPVRGQAVSLEQIGLMDFTRQLNTTFLVHQDRGTLVNLHLIEVRPVVPPDGALSYAEDARNEKFSLLFQGSPGSPLEQNTYTFEHQRVGSFEMFIVPVGHLDQGFCCYEAIFNRPWSGDRRRDFRVQIR